MDVGRQRCGCSFGTASYFMPQYLRKLGESGLDYCLMFYKDDYTPAEFEEMHHFTYDRMQLKSMFPNCNIYNHKNFVTISSKKSPGNRQQ